MTELKNVYTVTLHKHETIKSVQIITVNATSVEEAEKLARKEVTQNMGQYNWRTVVADTLILTDAVVNKQKDPVK